jgi:hypothetical protein
VCRLRFIKSLDNEEHVKKGEISFAGSFTCQSTPPAVWQIAQSARTKARMQYLPVKMTEHQTPAHDRA